VAAKASTGVLAEQPVFLLYALEFFEHRTREEQQEEDDGAAENSSLWKILFE